MKNVLTNVKYINKSININNIFNILLIFLYKKYYNYNYKYNYTYLINNNFYIYIYIYINMKNNSNKNNIYIIFFIILTLGIILSIIYLFHIKNKKYESYYNLPSPVKKNIDLSFSLDKGAQQNLNLELTDNTNLKKSIKSPRQKNNMDDFELDLNGFGINQKFSINSMKNS